MGTHQMIFDQIAAKLSHNLSLMQEVSDVLNISSDSAYRRIRGEKALTIDEAIALCQHYNLSLDNLLHINGSSHVLFDVQPVRPGVFDATVWLNTILTTITHLYNGREKSIVYAAKDPPIFSYFQFPMLAAFKFFFWSKTLFHINEYEKRRFNLLHFDKEFEAKCQHISDISMKIPTIEIWNEDTFGILMRQIEYHWVSGYFESKEQLELLLEQIETWLNHNKKQAEYGFRFRHTDEPVGIANSYHLYENEVVLNDNTIYTLRDGVGTVFHTFNVLGLISTTNKEYCESIASFHKVLMSKSNLISQTAEKERNRFFNKLHLIIDQFRAHHL